jgi:hypothetical protein
VGTGLPFPDNIRRAFTPGTRLADLPDQEYAKGISETYLSVLRTGCPKIEDVSAKISWSQTGRLLYEYRRMILPCLDANGDPLLLSASVPAVRLRTLEAA